MEFIEDVACLEQLYGTPNLASTIKEVPHLIEPYADFIKQSPFCMMATFGEQGMDCSPRGDRPGFVKIINERTLAMPDRRGNNRIDSIRNIVETGKIALCFMIPGSRNCMRVNGTAKVTTDAELCESFGVDGKAPRSVIVIQTQSVYFQCGRAIVRSRLWEPEAMVDPSELPTPGEVLEFLSKSEIDGSQYDAQWEARAQQTLW